MANKNACGVYFIFKSMEQGPSFRISVPKYPTQDPHHRILARQRSRIVAGKRGVCGPRTFVRRRYEGAS